MQFLGGKDRGEEQGGGGRRLGGMRKDEGIQNLEGNGIGKW